MRVVHITENPIAGAPYNIHAALNSYTEVCSRLIGAHPNNGNRVFPYDLIIGSQTEEEIRSVINEADIIHMHNFYKEQTLFRLWPDLWPIVMKKPRVWQAHTQRDCKWVNLNIPMEDKTMKHLVIAQYHTRQYPECEVVPNIIDIWDQKYQPRFMEGLLPMVVYSPSNVNLQGWDDKGYEPTKKALNELDRRGLIDFDMVIDVPHQQCMLRKSLGEIGIDEIITGSYHLCSLENLALGLATIAHLDEQTRTAVFKVTGQHILPWIDATKSTLLPTLMELIKDRKALMQKRRESRAWMEQHWDPKLLVHTFTRIYQQL